MRSRIIDLLHRPYLYLLVFLLLSFLLVPMVAWGRGFGAALDVLFYLIVIIGLRSIRRSWFSRSLMVLAPVFIAGDVYAMFSRDVRVMVAIGFLGALIMLGVCLSLVRSILGSRQITRDIVMGGICVFLLQGLMWYMIYVPMFLLDPASFDFTVHGLKPDLMNASVLIFYFSFSCLLTSGFGDVLPMTDWGQCLSVFEGVVGQLYLVVFIARLVSLQPRHASESTAEKHTMSDLD